MARMEAQLTQNEVATENNLEVEITSKHVNGNKTQNGQQANDTVPLANGKKKGKQPMVPKKPGKQVLGQCKKCGYISSQDVCKACVLLEGLNKGRPKNNIEVHDIEEELKKTSVGGD